MHSHILKNNIQKLSVEKYRSYANPYANYSLLDPLKQRV